MTAIEVTSPPSGGSVVVATPTGPRGPAGKGVLVLGPADVIPPGTPPDTVVFRKTS